MHFIYEKSSMKVIPTHYYYLIPIYLQTYFIDSVGSKNLSRTYQRFTISC